MSAVVAPRGADAVPDSGWLARLELGFAPRSRRTVPVHRRHEGPLRIQRVFHPEGEPCHVYILHPPGGVVGGDRLQVRVDAEPGSHALLTTPAATKFYRSAGATARQDQRLAVAAGATVEWLPQEQIVFDGARVDARTRVDLDAGARFIGWDLTCLGRPAGGHLFRRGEWRSAFEIWRDGRPLLVERMRFTGGDDVLTQSWGLGGAGASALLAATGADAQVLETVRDAADGAPGRVAATLLDDLLVVRWLGPGAAAGFGILEHLWSVLRPLLLGRPACPPRIWRT